MTSKLNLLLVFRLNDDDEFGGAIPTLRCKRGFGGMGANVYVNVAVGILFYKWELKLQCDGSLLRGAHHWPVKVYFSPVVVVVVVPRAHDSITPSL